jgi:hypothetical protein
MTDEQRLTMPSPPHSSTQRESLYLLLGCLAVLLTCSLLTPDPRGYGTHRQLLMPPCVLHAITGVPCPFCGMTTGFAHMARGQVLAAARANLMAPPIFLLTIVIGLLALWGAVTARPWVPALVRTPSFSRWLLVVILLFWAANIALHYSVVTR